MFGKQCLLEASRGFRHATCCTSCSQKHIEKRRKKKKSCKYQIHLFLHCRKHWQVMKTRSHVTVLSWTQLYYNFKAIYVPPPPPFFQLKIYGFFFLYFSRLMASSEETKPKFLVPSIISLPASELSSEDRSRRTKVLRRLRKIGETCQIINMNEKY